MSAVVESWCLILLRVCRRVCLSTVKDGVCGIPLLPQLCPICVAIDLSAMAHHPRKTDIVLIGGIHYSLPLKSSKRRMASYN